MRRGLALAALLLLAACSKLTLDNYNKIESGMAYDEVVGLIGKPDSCDDLLGMKQCTWGDDTRSASVSFVDGKVLLHVAKNLD